MRDDLTHRVDAAPRGAHIGALFDLDRTLLDGFSVYSFMQERITSGHMGAGELRANLVTMAGYKLGQIGMSGAMRGSAQALRGMSEQSMIDLGWQVFEKHLARRIYPEARALVEAHRARGHSLAIVSSATRYQIEPIAYVLGIDTVLCTELEVENGEFTGNIATACWKEGKARAAKQLQRERKLELDASFFYTDAAEDLPLLELVGNPHVLNPDAELAAIAAQRKWPIDRFARRRPTLQDTVRTGIAYGAMVPATFAGLSARVLSGSSRHGSNLTKTVWGDFAVAALGMDIRANGREHLWSHRPAIFVFNHQSAADALIMGYLLRQDFTGIAKIEASRNPLVGPFLKSAGVVFIDRANARRAIDAMKPAVDAVKDGMSIVLAPEGTRSTTEHMGPFKKGAFHLAMQAGVPMVPVVIHNAADAQPKGQRTFRPATIRVDILPPMDTSGWTAATMNEHVAEVRGMMQAALGQSDETAEIAERTSAHAREKLTRRPPAKAKRRIKAKTGPNAKTRRSVEPGAAGKLKPREASKAEPKAAGKSKPKSSGKAKTKAASKAKPKAARKRKPATTGKSRSTTAGKPGRKASSKPGAVSTRRASTTRKKS